MLEVLPKIAKMQASYALGKPIALPMNLTISVSYRCNSRCKTCNVWQRPNDDFTLEEYDKTFASIGRDAYWFTFSGGGAALRANPPPPGGGGRPPLPPRPLHISSHPPPQQNIPTALP